ncbi:BON domain-containing protein [Nocardiopsis sp. CC223A]|uniref:BON domain-containing protein n=1 Tax=Nocardiopsis sp. CC223A TaxID=3044051 RepID=UPI0027961926|nr:BON domain-containing protein [Nocardiopsis sp. CC223A]
MAGATQSALSDRLIGAKIRGDLAERLGLPEEAIAVESTGGRVTLSSVLPVTEDQRREAIAIAAATHGVTGVSAEGLDVERTLRRRSATGAE